MESDDENQWVYVLLEVRVDPEHREDTKDVQIDEVSWKSFIFTALKRLHGQFGASIDTEIVMNKGKKAVAKIQKEDLLTFKSSIISFGINLSSIGYDDIDAYITIELLKDIQSDTELDKIDI